MAFGTEVYESSFKARLYASHFAFVDVCFLLLSRAGFDIKVVEFLPVNEGNTQLFTLSRVNKHSFHSQRPDGAVTGGQNRFRA